MLTFKITINSIVYDISGDIISAGMEMYVSLHEEMTPNTNKLSFKLRRNATVIPLLLQNDLPVHIEVKDGAAFYFCGYLTDDYASGIRNSGPEDFSLNAEDPGIKKLQIAWKSSNSLFTKWDDVTLCKPADTANSFVHKLAALAGVTVDSSVVLVSKTLSISIKDSDKKTYWEILKDILFNFGHTFYFNEAGNLCLYNFNQTNTIPNGTLYASNFKSSLDGWVGNSGTPTYANGKLSTTAAVNGAYKLSMADCRNKTMRIQIYAATNCTISFAYYGNSTYTNLGSKTVTSGQWNLFNFVFPNAAYSITGISFACSSVSALDVGMVLIGDDSTVFSTDKTANIDVNGNTDAGVSYKKKRQQYKQIDVKWKERRTVSNVVVFHDTTGQTSIYDCLISVPAYGYYPTGSSATNYVMSDYKLEDGNELVNVVSATADIVVDSGVTYEFENTGKQAKLRIYNNNATAKNIYKIKITGTSVVEKLNETTEEVGSGTPILAYSADYLSVQADAKALANIIEQFYRYGDFNYVIKSKTKLSVGTNIYLLDPLWTKLCNKLVILGRTDRYLSNQKLSYYEYECVGIDDFNIAATTTSYITTLVDASPLSPGNVVTMPVLAGGSLPIAGTINGGTLSGINVASATLSSSNFVTGVSGYQFKADGNAEFNNIVVRGTAYLTNGTLSSLTVNGNITVGSGGTITGTGYSLGQTSSTIGAFTIGTNSISATNLGINSGAANVANINVGTGANSGGLNSAASASDITFWSGSTFANRATANFRVTASGALTASNATITGTITTSALNATGGSVAAFTLTGNSIAAPNFALTSGAANTANLTIGAGANAAGLNSPAAGTDIAFWAGSTFANRATAPFFVTAAGAVSSTSITVGSATKYLKFDGTNLSIATPNFSIDTAGNVSVGGVISSTSTLSTIAGLTATSSYIQSPSYVAGVSGFKIINDGSAEFNNVLVRGTVYASAGSFAGAVTANSGSIAGFSLAAGAISATNLSIISGAANVANITAGAGANAAGLNSAASSSDIAIWAGSAFANRSAAPLRITAGGALTATGVNLTGTINATSGNFTGTVSGSTIKSSDGKIRIDPAMASGNQGLTLTDFDTDTTPVTGNVRTTFTTADGYGLSIRFQRYGTSSWVHNGALLFTNGYTYLASIDPTGVQRGYVRTSCDGGSGGTVMVYGATSINIQAPAVAINGNITNSSNGTYSIGTSAYKYKDAFFSGSVNSTIVDNANGTITNPLVKAGAGIIEHGYNTNGDYIKFDDGTLIQSGKTVIYFNNVNSASATITFAAAFISTPVCTYSPDNHVGGVDHVFVGAGNGVYTQFPSTTGTSVAGLSWTGASLNYSVRVSWTAIGRWE